MRLDYWNNPLVVSAYRVRFRGGTPAFIAATYFLILVGLGGILHYNLADDPNVSWVAVYCVSLFAVETVIAGVSAMMATHQSMHAEVTNRTLDYQRIAAVPPRDILLGKLLGEPAQGYLMALAGVPLLIWCWGMGAVTFGVLSALALQIVTTAFLLGSIGLIYPLDAGEKTRGAGRMIRIVVVVLAFIYTAPLVIMAPFLTTNPLTQIPVGFLTPVLGIVGLARGNATLDRLPVFDWQIPYLLITPLTQVIVGVVFLHSISRRMISPVNVALGKPLAYGIVAAIDVVAAGVLGDPRTMTPTLGASVATFCLIHIAFSLLMTMAVTPGRECLRSWVWRFRGRMPYWRDLWYGERSENIGALVTFCAMGVVATVLLVIMPVGAKAAAGPDFAALLANESDKLVALCLLILSVGAAYQLVVSIGPALPMVFAAFLAALVIAPHVAGLYLQWPIMMAISPSAQFAHWIGHEPSELPFWPFVATYGVILALARIAISRRIASAIRLVDARVLEMIVVAEPPSGIAATQSTDFSASEAAR
ncbi:MAG TPA: hypothetical protein VGN12_23655 [Pirellulales bacterium]|jgi:hypothetical protein